MKKNTFGTILRFVENEDLGKKYFYKNFGKNISKIICQKTNDKIKFKIQ